MKKLEDFKDLDQFENIKSTSKEVNFYLKLKIFEFGLTSSSLPQQRGSPHAKRSTGNPEPKT